ncbi:Outer membrane protein P6 precursor [Marinobacter litoralis]|uniref:Outer membrane protein P6 n=1 Tax=Marinobacter litoralis TaxID=187981 RepID=A0A3M2RCS9_9GAMM|nr:OmpA family protein [Marinobacter litoralis]RMJ03108.1 Outer membrane protein P6 precursor [Marinobacter litoralis]
MTTLVLDNPEMLAKAALLSGFNAAQQRQEAGRPHRTRFHYSFNKHTLDATDTEILKQHAAYLKRNPGTRIKIHGHSDNFGSGDYNQFLARLRAHAVVKLLTQEGVSPSAMIMTTWGAERPLARPEDHAANRRVELEYLSMDIAQAL